ncbi:MAG: tetratricopeptide repeat protein [Planctomycetota bacterium]
MTDRQRRSVAFAICLQLALLAVLTGCEEQARPNITPTDKSLVDAEWAKGAERPPEPRTLFAMAKLLVAQGRDDQAYYVLERLITEHPKFVMAYVEQASIHMRHRRLAAAETALKRGLRASPNDGVLLNDLGMVHLFLRDYKGALKDFRKATGVAPDNTRYRANMAMALGMLGRYEECLAVYEQVLMSADAHFNLGVICEARNDTQRAEQEYAKYRQLQRAIETPEPVEEGAEESSEVTGPAETPMVVECTVEPEGKLAETPAPVCDDAAEAPAATPASELAPVEELVLPPAPTPVEPAPAEAAPLGPKGDASDPIAPQDDQHVEVVESSPETPAVTGATFVKVEPVEADEADEQLLAGPAAHEMAELHHAEAVAEHDEPVESAEPVKEHLPGDLITFLLEDDSADHQSDRAGHETETVHTELPAEEAVDEVVDDWAEPTDLDLLEESTEATSDEPAHEAASDDEHNDMLFFTELSVDASSDSPPCTWSVLDSSLVWDPASLAGYGLGEQWTAALSGPE